MSQIFLFTGQNTYTLNQEKRRWMQNFSQKHGDENLIRLEASKVQRRVLLDEIASAPFIAEKRLVVIDGIPRLEKEDIDMIEKHIHPDVIVLFVEPKPDKRFSAVKELLKRAEIKTFMPQSHGQLLQWIREFAQEQGGSIEPSAQELLLSMVGEDQELIAQELTKLALYADGRAITEADCEEMIICAGEQVSWKLMDLLASGKTEEGLRYARTLINRGESPHALWSQLLWMISNLIALSSAVQEGQTNIGAIAKSTGVNFGAARSLFPLARRLDTQKLKEIADRFAGSDIDLKTGAIRATAEAPQELESLIDRCIYSLH